MILVACFSAPIYAQINPEAGAFYLKQYLPESYGANTQNWAATQDLTGVMYFGNTDGLLAYDGASWQKTILPNRSAVRSLAVDDKGTVWIGGEGEIGFLQREGLNRLRYVSLMEHIPVADRRFGDVWTTSCTKAGVLFGSYQRIFRWSPNGEMKIWRPQTSFGRVFAIDDVPYVVQMGSGLMRIVGKYPEADPGGGLRPSVGDYLEPVPGGDLFKKDRWYEVFSDAGTLMFASSRTLYRQTPKGFVVYPTDAAELLSENGIYACRALRNGDLAVATARGGLILLTPDGHLDRIINKQSGLPSSSVNAFYEDRDGSLWLALALGIAHVQIELPLTHYNDHEGLEEIVLSIVRKDKQLYAGTMIGLSKLTLSRGAKPHFEALNGIKGQVFALLPTSNGLLEGGQLGVSEVTANGIRKIREQTNVYSLSPSVHDPDLVFAAGAGLFVLHHEQGEWKTVREVPSDGQDFLSALEDSNGKIWATARTGIWRIDLGTDPASIERFGAPQGIPAGWNFAFRVQNRVLFGTPKGLLKFDQDGRRFVPENRFGEMFADGSRAVSIVREGPTGDIWISGDGYHGVLHRTSDGKYTWEENPLARSRIKELYTLFLDSDDVVWASGADGGLVRYKVRNTNEAGNDFRALVNDVQLLHNGEKPELSPSSVGSKGAPATLENIPHQQNAIRFQFSAPSFEDEARTEYQVRLEGLDRAWSEWSAVTRKEYTNLWEGNYVFHVRARDLHGRISQEGVIAFHVLPPFYRTWSAYALYVPLFVGCMWLIIRWRLRNLAESNRKLEVIIDERTDEIRRQRDEIKLEEERTEALLLTILPQAVADELRSTGSVTPKAYDSISVCFTDFVGFTISSEKVTASDLVAALHRYFTAFDEIVERHGLEKLKTIGDSYMFVGGLPERRPSHAVDVVLAAMEMADVVAKMSDSHPAWKVRIGVHSGPVVAGVVGVKKFAFDIWGETVNFASRFESSGAPNKVNLSARTHDLICDFIDCQPRGLVQIKEGRRLEMYFAQQVRPELLSDDPDSPHARFSELYYERFGERPRVQPVKSTVLNEHSAGAPFISAGT